MLSADSFAPDIYLEGFYQVENNTLNYYHFDKGFSISPHHRNRLTRNIPKNEPTVFYDENLVKVELKINEIQLFHPIYFSLENYFQNNFVAVFEKKLAEKIDELLGNTEREEGSGLIPEIVIELPKIALPKAVRKFMGNKAGRLNLDGSQKLTIAGNNTTRDNAALAENESRGDFDLELKQDLDILLKGTIGEKIHVNVNHRTSSDENAIPEPTEINVSYEGDEDEIVKKIEGGNIALALSGSKFFNYSVSSEGLFGIKSELKAGNLEITSIIGRDEAKKNTQKITGTSQADSVTIQSRNFVERTHYFLYPPESMYQLYSDADGTEGVDYPIGWKDNAIKLNDKGEWIIKNGKILPDPAKEVTVYLDDHNANNNTTTISGFETGYPDNLYNFDVLIEGSDYIIDYDAGILILNNSIQKKYTIGITFTDIDGNQVGDDSSSPVEVKLLRYTNQDVNEEYWDLQIRNIYNFNMQNIKNEGFELNVFTKNADDTPNYNLPSEISFGDWNTINEYLRLDVNGDGVINGEDATVNLAAGYLVMPFLRPFEAIGDSLIYVDENVNYNEIENYISVKGEIGREFISLNQMNILPNSVTVRLGPEKRELKENIDYIVDYDFGIVTFLSSEAKDSDAEIEIDFQYRPLFAVDSKTILGTRADLQLNQNCKIGGTIIYQSEKVKEDRPKIGNENRSIFLADLDAELEYDVPFLTKAIDWLPLIKTDSDSKIRLTGEVAMSIPRIYGSDKQHDKKEAYVDDMEGILDSYPLGVTRTSWSPASKPATYPTGNFIDYNRAKINYYSPTNIYMRDVYDTSSLSEEEENDKVSVLACKIKPLELNMPGSTTKHWAGLMKYLGNQLDFSKKKYIEFLVRVDTLNYNIEQKPVTMHINLGDINENFYTFTDENGEGKLDMEDGLKYRDGILDLEEDVGLDRIADGNPGDDPYDNWSNEKVIINGEEEYPYINGTEGNNRLDTEDLDANGLLNTEDVYFEYSTVLTEDSEYLLNEYKGWRLYRIPMQNSKNYSIISNQSNVQPNIEKINYARVWFEVEDSTRIKIATLDLVGNKWEEDGIRNEVGNIVSSESETMNVGIIDNQKNQHYTPAPHTEIKDMGESTLEQSLIIDYNNLQENHYGLVMQEFLESFNLLSYNKIRLWVYAELAENTFSREEADSLIYRLGADSTDYYEIRHPIAIQTYQTEMDYDAWKEIEIDFSDISHLKTLERNDLTSYKKGESRFIKVGNPTLSNIRTMWLGMKATETFTGRIYFDDIRVADPYEDIGYAARTSFHTSFADFSTFDISLDWKSQNFQSSAKRQRNLDYKENFSLNVSNKYNINKFFPAEWGLNIPLNLTRNQSLSIPRFKTNSDILRKDLTEEDKEKEKTESLTHRATLNFSQNKTPRSKILELMIKNTSVNSSIERMQSLQANSADTTFTFDAKHTYDLDIPKESSDIKILSNYSFYFFPKSFTNTFKFKLSEPDRYYWDTNNDTLPQWVKRPNQQDTKTFDTDTRIEYDIFSDIGTSYKLTTNRDLMRKNYLHDINIGDEKRRNQNISLNYDPHYIDNVFVFSGTASSIYDEVHEKTSSQDTLYYKGNVTRKLTGNITLKNKELLLSLAEFLDKEKKETDEEKTGEEKKDSTKEENKGGEEEQKRREEEAAEERKKREEAEKQKNRTEEELKKQKEILPGKEEKDKTGEEKERKGKEEQKEQTSSRRNNLAAAIIAYFGRMDNIQLQYSNNYKTSYDDRKERPEFLYQLGLPHILNEEGPDSEINLKTITDDYSTSLGFPILNYLSTTVGYSLNITKNYGDRDNEKITTTFPNIAITLSEFEKLIHAEKILTSSRLTSTYVRSTTKDGDLDFTEPESENIRHSYSPLISWHGNWLHNITSTISYNWTTSQNTRFLNSGNTGSNSDAKSVNGQLSWSFSNPRGLKIPFLKRTNLKNELTTDLNFSWEKNYDTTFGQEEVVNNNRVKYTIAPGASYKFNRSVDAGLTGEYSWNNDKKDGKIIKTVRIAIWIEIRF